MWEFFSFHASRHPFSLTFLGFCFSTLCCEPKKLITLNTAFCVWKAAADDDFYLCLLPKIEQTFFYINGMSRSSRNILRSMFEFYSTKWVTEKSRFPQIGKYHFCTNWNLLPRTDCCYVERILKKLPNCFKLVPQF